MAVYTVKATMPNGTGISAPVIADTAAEAQDYFAATHEIETADKAVFDVALREDPNGELERLLMEGEIRRREAEFYRFETRRRGRR